MSRPLAKELEEYGVSMDPGMYKDMLQDVKNAVAPSWSIGEFLRNPDEEKRLCVRVRAETKSRMPDPVILRHLENIRKGGTESAG